MDYNEALLFVSHDRWFIEKFATRIWEMHDGKITDFRGTFSEYREYKARQQTFAQANAKREEKASPKKPKKKGSPSPEKQLAKIERDIAALEEKIAENDRLAAEFSTDYQKLMALGSEREELSARLDALYEQWEELSE